MKLTKRQKEAITLLKSHKDNFIFYRLAPRCYDRVFDCYVSYNDHGKKRIRIIDYRTGGSLESKNLLVKKKLNSIITVYSDEFQYGSVFLNEIWTLKPTSKGAIT